MNAKKVPGKLKPRNPLVAPTLVRKAGKHLPDPKGTRRTSNRKAELEAEQSLRGRDREK